MRRLSIRLPDPAHERLEQQALATGLPVARAATDLLCTSLEPDNAPATTPTTRNPRGLATKPSQPGPPWLPSDIDPHWAENTWHAILALHRRYPDALANLEHDWHERPERVEVLAALATWRDSIDAAAEDPREELSFHNALQQLARALDHTAGLTRPFDPGPRSRPPGLRPHKSPPFRVPHSRPSRSLASFHGAGGDRDSTADRD